LPRLADQNSVFIRLTEEYTDPVVWLFAIDLFESFGMSISPGTDIKADAHRLIDSLPQNATWDDIMQRIYVRQCIESGLEDAKAGRVESVESVRTRFGLKS